METSPFSAALENQSDKPRLINNLATNSLVYGCQKSIALN
jgi:hypothetical protein